MDRLLTRPAPVTPASRTVPAAADFRPDIQALRALAVAAVVIYHLFPRALPGGFVGVDVFFVISGYLITQHLVKELLATGSIRLTQFWARRIRRLLPAAFVVLAASVVLVVALMPRLTWQSNLQQVGFSAAYVQNWLLGFTAVDYLGAHDSATVAQHYWSLSVEEQFYLVWPVLLLVTFAANRALRRWSVTTVLTGMLSAVAVVSLALSLYLTAAQQPMAFFSTATRAWEFAVGGLLAMVPAARLGAPASPRRGLLSLAGVVLVAAAVVLITGQLPFPGVVALLPVVGAGLIMVSGGPVARWSPARALAWPPVQWVGNYSYSIYLWHWPLIIVAPWALREPTPAVAKVVILLLTLGLAYLTKRFVEDPVRRGRSWQARKQTYAFAALGMGILLVVPALVHLQIQQSNDRRAATTQVQLDADTRCYGAAALDPAGSCIDPFARPAGLDLAFAASDEGAPDSCQPDTGVTTLTLCPFGQTESPSRTIVVVGNSHALRLAPALEQYGRSRGWEIILAAKTDCMGLISSPVGDQAADTCQAWSGALQERLLSMPDLDAVVFASHASAQDYLAGVGATPAEVAEADRRVLVTWSALRQRGTAVLVASDVPGMRPESDPDCIAMSRVAYDPCTFPRAAVVTPNLMSTLAQQHPDLVDYLDLTPYFCDDQLCHGLIGGVVVYSDSHHLTGTYSRSLGRFLGPEIEAALTRQR